MKPKGKPNTAWQIPDHGGVASRTSVSFDANDVAILADCVRALAHVSCGRITYTDVLRLALQRLWQSIYGEAGDATFRELGTHPGHWSRCQVCGSEPVLLGRYCDQCGTLVTPPAAIPFAVKDSEED